MIKVMLPPKDLVKPSWSYESTIDSPLDEVGFHGLAIDYEIENSELSSIFHSDVCHGKLLNYPDQVEVHVDPSSKEHQLFDEVEDYFDWMEYEGNSSSPEPSIDCASPSINFGTSKRSSLVFPKEEMEIDDTLSISNLLKAFGEAKENRFNDLAYVISKRLEEKACPKGSIHHRLAYYLVQSSNSNLDHYYLAQEALKNYDAALSLFYQIFPYGRLAHFVGNSTILEALPEDAKMIHIVDFELGEGVQWPPLIEAISIKHPKVAVRLISLKDGNNDDVAPLQSFANTKKLLSEYAYSYSHGLNLKVEEMGIEKLAIEMKRIARKKENWVAFNCMRDLPHMVKSKNSRHITDFLELAQEYIGGYNSNNGIITFGSGSHAEEKNIDNQGFGSRFEAESRRIIALLELMELQMPLHLGEARVAMECLFVAPYINSLDIWETRKSKVDFSTNIGLKARKISQCVVSEAKELVGEMGGVYSVRTEGNNENEVVLSYKGTPLLRVSSWGN